MREGDIIAKQFWGDIIANLLHAFSSRLTAPGWRVSLALFFGRWLNDPRPFLG